MSGSIDLHSFLRSRRSIRHFDSEPIPAALIERMITTATFAPSAHNCQPWRFIIVLTASGKSLLADSMASEYQRDLATGGMIPGEVNTLIEKSRSRIKSAPLAVVLCMDDSDIKDHPDVKRSNVERTMALQSVANAGLMLLLAAHAESLGGVWLCGPLYAPRAVSLALDLPTTWEPQALFLMGKPTEAPPPPSRKPVKDITIFR